ncbi:hypothetical protein P8C59_009315 [Phyllachora maydis]|uniref:Uncharacterized protein n=1 Tax=Phyllachora maydis TaxID=1825666 RepID=A0AAD9MG50_9PEZI|nr:hypothetical protein P8C59_009315 [Phyllachora maydis]
MAPLTDADIEKLFSGAPQFFARSEGHNTGAPHPSVAFPWDDELKIRDLTDHTQIEDKAWSSVTAWPHIVRASSAHGSPRAKENVPRAHFYPRCRERPNMLSMMGLEKGSLGFQGALEIAVADALLDEQWGFDRLATRPSAIMEQRQKMLASKDGLRHIDETVILELLMRNGRRYAEQYTRKRRLSSELYNELFIQVLHPPSKVTHHKDPYGLPVQIAALVTVLATPNVWIDFSHVEWRIRLGQLLWGSPEDELADGAEIQEERYWALLQILLACELLLRLDAITEGDEQGLESIRPCEILQFEKSAQPSVKWAINTARAWLENVEVVKTEAAGHTAVGKPAGWLAMLTKRMRRQISAALHPSGWLSKTYISGLILPGEVLCHYLMASLLETDEEAIPGKGSMECMGWISTDITPRNLGDGWVTIEVNDIADDIKLVNKKARLWGKTTIEREGAVLGNVMEEARILPGDFVIPYDNAYREPPPSNLRIELRDLQLTPPGALGESPDDSSGHPLHKYFTYISIHLSELLAKQSSSFEELLANSSSSAHKPSLTPTPTPASAARVLVIDCITGFQSLPQEHEIPLSPVVSRSSTHSCSRTADNGASPRPRPLYHARSTSSVTAGEAGKMMHTETRRRHFGSDMEILVRAICAEKGWNALISRRRRGCLACAIREAGALGWKVYTCVTTSRTQCDSWIRLPGSQYLASGCFLVKHWPSSAAFFPRPSQSAPSTASM